MSEDEDEDDAATLFHAAAHAVHAEAEATVAKGEGLSTLLTGVGVGAALLGAAFLVTAKEHVAEAPKAAVESAPLALASPGRNSSALPLSEADFISRAEFKSAEYQGRLIADSDGLGFDTGTSAFALAKYDAGSGRMVPDRDATLKAARFAGDLAFCRSIPDAELFKCWALHNGTVIDIEQPEGPL